MRTIPCPLCGAKEHVPVCEKAVRSVAYRSVRCAACGFHFVNPQPEPDELTAFYDASYSCNHGSVWHGLEDRLNRDVILRLRRLGVRSLLDFGAGQGRFVRMALDAGLRAEGVEPSEINCRAASDRYGVALRRESIEEYLLEAGSPADCATMLNVLEHLADPVGVLRRVAGRLTDGGTLLVVVPNVTFTLALGGVRRALGFRDVYMLASPRFRQQGFDPPVHLSSFSAPSLARALALGGFNVVALEHAPNIGATDMIVRLAKWGVRAGGEVLRRVTLNRVMAGHSILAVGRKRAA